MTQTYSTDLDTKVSVRKRGMAALGPLPDGARIWMPCSGKGDMAAAMTDLWPIDRIDPIDNDLAMVRHWNNRFADEGSECVAGDANTWTPEPGTVYAVADIDSFGQPYTILQRFVGEARMSDPCLIVLTDGAGRMRRQYSKPFDWEVMRFGAKDSERAQDQHENLPEETVQWLATLSQISTAKVVEASINSRYLWYVAILVSPAEAFDDSDPDGRPVLVSTDHPKQAFAGITSGETRAGISDGQWNFWDAITELAHQLRKASPTLTVATWTISPKGVDILASLHANGADVKVIVGDGMLNTETSRGRYEHLIDRISEDRVSVWSSHMKFAVFDTDDHQQSALYVTSANLNRNNRLESWVLWKGGDLPRIWQQLAEQAGQPKTAAQSKAQMESIVTRSRYRPSRTEPDHLPAGPVPGSIQEEVIILGGQVHARQQELDGAQPPLDIVTPSRIPLAAMGRIAASIDSARDLSEVAPVLWQRLDDANSTVTRLLALRTPEELAAQIHTP